ncbi:MAG TPA: hypothetical protein VK508_02760 [Cyclobacteriaceae bacterium]|nr:hypothetical protein [Cyclobacteriaceae bacterium]
MKVFRNRIVARTLAVFFIILTLANLVGPSEALALTSGPHQPEYMGYEEPGSTDMVNLVNGDFTISPVTIEVPGPEGSFSFPLTYNAGVGPDQEASWVGLGWTMNAGAITRSINAYPDDASGQYQSITMADLTGVRGWSSSALGFGEIGWNTSQGHYGAITLLGLLDVNYDDKGLSSVGVAGISVSKTGLHVDPLKLAMAAVTVATMGAGSLETVGAVLKNLALNSSSGAALSLVFSAGTPAAPTIGFWEYSKRKEQRLFHKNYWIWLDQTRTEQMYGTLNLSSIPTQNFTGTSSGPSLTVKKNDTTQANVKKFVPTSPATGLGAASDVNYSVNDGQSYRQSNNPFQIATDNFSVGGLGISGTIKPYRFDVGSVATPREMTDNHIRLAPVPFYNYKVPFIYDGSYSNNYFHTVGKVSGSISQPDYYYGLAHNVAGSAMTYDLKDVAFSQRLRTDAGTYKAIPQSNQVSWYSIHELTTAAPFNEGYLDFLESTERASFRSQVFSVVAPGGFANEAPANGSIAAYSITRSDGVTFHYGLPVYDYNYSSKISDKSDANKYSYIARNSPFANTWLLTSITGPDFVDRNSNKVADRDDWGYWVRFHYGKHSQDYQWRTPYDAGATDFLNQHETYTQGEKQQYYLNSIETRSHRAVFMKSTRLDNQGYTQDGNSMRLDEVCILRNEDFDRILAPTGNGGCNLTNCNNSVTKEWLTSDFYSGLTYTCAGNIVKANAVKRIKFTYDYSLCKNTPNSFETNKGKLTLKRLSMIGRNDVKVMPDYIFDYANNPNYDVDKWDAWGYYSSTGTSTVTSHAPGVSSDGAAWSLTKVTNPLGSELLINYERDDYTSVAGQMLQGLSWPGSASCSSCAPQAGTTVISLTGANQIFTVGENVQVKGIATFQCSGVSTQYPFVNTSANITALTSNSLTLDAAVGNIYSCVSPGTSVSWSVEVLRSNRIGGNLRVGSIVVQDQGTQAKTRYKYFNGTVSREPDQLWSGAYSFYDLPNYPSTPVMYGRVEVLKGALTSDTDFHTREQYDFEVPFQSVTPTSASNMIVVNTDVVSNNVSTANNGALNKYHFKIDDNMSRVGAIKAIRTFDAAGNQRVTKELTYSSTLAGYQGVFTESTLMAERIIEGSNAYDRMSRTTTRKNPYVLITTTTQKDGFSSSATNKAFDMITGKILETVETSPSGFSVKTISVPAYTKYPGMASKIVSSGNKHMLTQDAATYVYSVDAIGNALSLISAQATTWKNDWDKYRVLNSGVYSDQTDGPNIWRRHESWAYNGTYNERLSDGSLKLGATSEFNFASGTHTNWLKAGQSYRYDHYGMPLESKDMNLMSSSIKMGHSDKLKIAEAINAAYTEMSYCGAEDLNTTTNYFGGEVALGSGSVVSSPAHTGSKALSLSSGYGFTYKTDLLTPNRTYRASVWCNSSNGRIYYKVNGTETVPTVSPLSLGSWYLIQCEIPITTMTSFEVGVKTAAPGTAIFFDDFRFQPLDASMETFVHDASTGDLKYVLNNNNLYTMFEYDDRGSVTKVWQESFSNNGVKLVSESKENFRRFFINQ